MHIMVSLYLKVPIYDICFFGFKNEKLGWVLTYRPLEWNYFMEETIVTLIEVIYFILMLIFLIKTLIFNRR